MKRFILLAAMQGIILLSYSQEISLGETVPDISLGEFFNAPQKKLSLADLKGKLIIFDFWNVRCSACMVDMPRLDSLQAMFSDKIQIILVTQNSASEVEKLFNKIAMARPRLPIVINDTILYKMFPHSGDPFHAWVAPDGKLVALTNHENTNDVTIGNALKGLPINLPRRYNTSVDPGQLLVSEQNKMLLQLSYYHSALFRNVTNYSTGEMVRIRNSEDDGTGITTVNTTIPVLYHIAYSYSLFGMAISSFDLKRNNRILFETYNPDKFLRPSEVSEVTAWEEKNKLSYELNVPSSDSGFVYTYMQQDLDRYLPYSASLEKRLVRCLVLIRTDESDKLKAVDTTILPSRRIDSNKNIVTKNTTVTTAIVKPLITSLSFLDLPIIDGTNYCGRIDISIKSNLKTVDEFRAQLRKYGLDLKEMDKEISMLIIRDRKHKTTD